MRSFGLPIPGIPAPIGFPIAPIPPIPKPGFPAPPDPNRAAKGLAAFASVVGVAFAVDASGVAVEDGVEDAAVFGVGVVEEAGAGVDFEEDVVVPLLTK
jgi:hypothetical protein